ncbi:A disintegrin and metalloproteinase with thrombospondin motifs like isoform X2 [Prorops nasuta]
MVKSYPTSPQGLGYTKIRNPFATLIGTYHNIPNAAAFTVEKDEDGHYLFDGTIGQNITIKPLPARLRRAANIQHLQNQTQDQIHTHQHIMIKRSIQQKNIVQRLNFLKRIDMGKYSTSNRQVPDIIYPKVLITMDFGLYNIIGKNRQQAVRYITSLMKGVDLRYRMFINPKIRFNIAGIIIALDKYAVPYLEESRLNDTLLDCDDATFAMSNYFYKEDRFKQDFYDLAITLTSSDLSAMRNGSLKTTITGIAFLGVACQRDHRRHMALAVGIAEDRGGYNGIITVAHEIGHMLGARHDGSDFNTQNCPQTKGFIMSSTVTRSRNVLSWSPCSVKLLYEFINQDSARCLRVPPSNVGKILKTPLPGKSLTLDEQCLRTYGEDHKSCRATDPTVCFALWCGFKNNTFCYSRIPPAEGSPCGENLICLNGHCLPDTPEFI